MVEKAKWEGDVLGRKRYGDYLYKLALQRFNASRGRPEEGAICIALEADWGAGKTFFLDRWALDLRNQEHLVVRFNAWENDLSEDPLLGFMAGLKESLTPEFKRLPTAKRATAMLSKVVKNAPKAVWPTGKILAKALLQKVTSMHSDDFSDVGEALTGAIKETAPETLDMFFKEALKSHSERQRAIGGLRASLEELVTHLVNEQKIAAPLFVLVDELDRCRPDYAIRLLEGIKHLFNAKGVCFVLATNLEQLGASAQAVYGAAFNGYGYLKRFFAFEYRLPEPDHEAFAKMLCERSALRERKLIFRSALQFAGDPATTELMARNFSVVARFLRLSLRSQAQVFDRAEAAAAGIDDGRSVHVFFLFMLAGLFQAGAAHVESIRRRTETPADVFRKLGAVNFPVLYRTTQGDGTESESSTGPEPLFNLYFELCGQTVDGSMNKVQRIRRAQYPQVIEYAVLCDSGDEPKSWGKRDKLSVERYFDLVHMAGLTVGSASE